MKKASLAAMGAILALAISGCAGSAGGQKDGGDSSSGFAYEASQEQVNAALADLAPVTLKYQTAASSPNSILGRDKAWAESINKRSGGKITVEVVYGQAIAKFSEIHDALADGRVDIAYTLPGYDPAKFPKFDDLGFSLSLLPSSPLVSELVANATGLELSWNSEEVLKDFTDKGLVPLFPVTASANFYPACTEPGASAEDWKGRQLRTGSRAHQTMAQDLGATPVSMDFTETFEALQRKTIDCSFNSMSSAVDYGFLEVSPHVSYTTEVSVPRGPGAIIGGSKLKTLPLAYRQIIHDSMVELFMTNADIIVGGNFEGVAKVHKIGGTIEKFDDASQEIVAKGVQKRIEEIEGKGTFGSDLGEKVTATGEKWAKKAEELGYVDAGDFSDFDKWYDPETDYRPFAEAVYKELLLAHRPS